MVIHDKFITLSSHETFIVLGVKFITTTFNTNTRKAIHVIAIYKPSTLLFSTIINQLQKLLDVMPTYCPIVIMGDFNIDMFNQNSIYPNELKIFMIQYSMELQFKEITKIYGIHIDHIWTNKPIQQCILGVVEKY
jgi:endonuclease/exonuclease/phosphatase family metal-dependent hydrolase